MSPYLSTAFTHMRFLPSMDSGMYCQCRSLDELLSTSRVIASVRSDATVDPFYKKSGPSTALRGSTLTMAGKITPSSKALLASTASKSLWGPLILGPHSTKIVFSQGRMGVMPRDEIVGV